MILGFGKEFWKVPGLGPFCTSVIRKNPLARTLPGILFPTKQLRVDPEKRSPVSTLSYRKGKRKIQL